MAVAVSQCVARKPICEGEHVATTIENGIRYGEPAENDGKYTLGAAGNGVAANSGTYGDRIVVFCGLMWNDGKLPYHYVDGNI